MDARKREVRTVDCQLAVRETQEGQEGISRTISGTAIVFNSESEVLDEWGEKFREIILPSAATQEFLDTQDVKMNLLHERELTIARCNKGKGSMRLWVDERGVNFEFEAPNCDLGNRALELVRTGVYSGCSFEFYPKDYDIERTMDADGREEVIITHKSFELISSLTLGMDPAYKQTSVNARELGKAVESDEEIKAREEEEKEQQRKAEEERKIKMDIEMQRRADHLKSLADFDDNFDIL